MSSFRRLLGFLGPYRLHLALGLISVVITTATGLSLPLILRYLVDNVFDGVSRAEAADRLDHLVIAFVVLYGSRWMFQYATTYLISYTGYGVVKSIREQAYRHLMRLSLGYYETRSTGDVMSRVTNDVSAIQVGISQGAVDFVYSILSLVGVAIFVVVLNWKLALVTIFVIPLLGVTVGRFGERIRTVSRDVQAKLGELTAILQETISGIVVVKAFTTEDRETARFASKNADNMMANMRGARLLAILFPAVEAILAIGVLLVIFVGGKLVIAGDMTKGDLIAFLGYLALASTPASTLSRTYSMIQSSLAAADRVFELMDVEVSVDDRRGALALESVRGQVTFDNVGFHYRAGQPVLERVTLEVNPGEVIAIVGPSGAGKTSLVNLVARFYDATEGNVLVDGVDVRDVTVRSLRSKIAMVPQDSLLFSATLAENIAYGNSSAAMSDVYRAAEAANAHGFVMDLPKGYETVVGERGSTLSGGQRQRIAIARAVLRDPRILILDEATSALDTESEMLVQDALDKLMKGRTTFVIAHRLSTVRNADRIVVLEAGRIAEMGSHAALIERNGAYARLYRAQFERGAII